MKQHKYDICLSHLLENFLLQMLIQFTTIFRSKLGEIKSEYFGLCNNLKTLDYSGITLETIANPDTGALSMMPWYHAILTFDTTHKLAIWLHLLVSRNTKAILKHCFIWHNVTIQGNQYTFVQNMQYFSQRLFFTVSTL